MYITKKEYLKRVDNISIHELEKRYNIDSEIIEFIYDYNLLTDIIESVKIDDGNYIIDGLNENDFELIETQVKEIVEYELDNDNINDYLMDHADSKVDIYYSELDKWLYEFPESWEYMENVVFNGLIDFEKYDFYNHIQAAQYEYYSEILYNEYHGGLYELIEDITEYIADTLKGGE